MGTILAAGKKGKTGVRQDIHMGSGTEFFKQEEQYCEDKVTDMLWSLYVAQTWSEGLFWKGKQGSLSLLDYLKDFKLYFKNSRKIFRHK